MVQSSFLAISFPFAGLIIGLEPEGCSQYHKSLCRVNCSSSKPETPVRQLPGSFGFVVPGCFHSFQIVVVSPSPQAHYAKPEPGTTPPSATELSQNVHAMSVPAL
jgi:hypothetical protein